MERPTRRQRRAARRLRSSQRRLDRRWRHEPPRPAALREARRGASFDRVMEPASLRRCDRSSTRSPPSSTRSAPPVFGAARRKRGLEGAPLSGCTSRRRRRLKPGSTDGVGFVFVGGAFRLAVHAGVRSRTACDESGPRFPWRIEHVFDMNGGHGRRDHHHHGAASSCWVVWLWMWLVTGSPVCASWMIASVRCPRSTCWTRNWSVSSPSTTRSGDGRAGGGGPSLHYLSVMHRPLLATLNVWCRSQRGSMRCRLPIAARGRCPWECSRPAARVVTPHNEARSSTSCGPAPHVKHNGCSQRTGHYAPPPRHCRR